MALCRGLYLLSLLLLSKLLCVVGSQLPESLLCVDEHCKEKISEGVTLQRFHAPHKSKVSFLTNEKVTIYAKSNDKSYDVCFVEIRGRKGFAPTSLIKEERGFVSRDQLVPVKVDDVIQSGNDNGSKYNELLGISATASSSVVQGTTTDALQQPSPDAVQTPSTPLLPDKSLTAPALVTDKPLPTTAFPEVKSSLLGDTSQPLWNTHSAEQTCTIDGTPMYGEHCDNEPSDMHQHLPHSVTAGQPATTTPTPYGVNMKQQTGNSVEVPPTAVTKVLTKETLVNSLDVPRAEVTGGTVLHTNNTVGLNSKSDKGPSDIQENTEVVVSPPSQHENDTGEMVLGTKKGEPPAATEQKSDSHTSVTAANASTSATDKQGGSIPAVDSVEDTEQVKQTDPDAQVKESSLDSKVSAVRKTHSIPGDDDDDSEEDLDGVEVEVENDLDNTGEMDVERSHKLNSTLPDKASETVLTASTNVPPSLEATVDGGLMQKAESSVNTDAGGNGTFDGASTTSVGLPEFRSQEFGTKVSGLSPNSSGVIANSLPVTTSESLKSVSQRAEKSIAEATSTDSQHRVEETMATSSFQKLLSSRDGESSAMLQPGAATESLTLNSHLETPLLDSALTTLESAGNVPSSSAAVDSVSTSRAESVMESPLATVLSSELSLSKAALEEHSKNEVSEDSKADSEEKMMYGRRSLFSFSQLQGTTDTRALLPSPAAASIMEKSEAVSSHITVSSTNTEKPGTQHTDDISVAPAMQETGGPSNVVTKPEKDSPQEMTQYSEAKDTTVVPAVSEESLEAEPGSKVNDHPGADVSAASQEALETEVSLTVENSVETSPELPPLSSEDTENVELDDSVDNMVLYMNLLKDYLQIVVDVLPDPLHAALHDHQIRGLSPRVTVFTFLCGLFSVVLMVSFGCLLNNKKNTSLMMTIASLEKDLFNTRAERDVLREEVEQFKLQVSSSRKLSLEKQDQVKRLVKENKDLERSNQKLEAALHKVKDAWNEDRGQLDILSAQLHEKEDQIAELQCSSEKVKKEKEALSLKLTECEDILEKERAQVEHVRHSQQQLQSKLEVVQKTQEKLLQEKSTLNKRVEELSAKVETDAEEIHKLLRSLQDRDSENQVLQDCIKNLSVLQDMCKKAEDESSDTEPSAEVESCLNRLMDVGQMRIEYQKIKEQNDVLEEQLAAERRHLEKKKDQIEELQDEMEQLKRDTRDAQRERTEAVTKLEILSTYFKDREVQLQKEIGKQEVLRNQKDVDATTAEQQVSLLEQQNASYMSQLSSLKQEMEISERNYKNQITDQEKRAHENWLAARAAERKLEETNKELASMRQRLTLLQREKEQHTQAVLTNSHSGKALPPDDVQPGTLPIPSLPPPPPPMFLPPPPFMGEPFPHPPEPWMLHGGLPPPPPPPEVFKRHHRGSPGSFARASPGSSLRDDSPPPPPHSRGSPPVRLPHFYDSRAGPSPPPLGLNPHGPGLPPMALGFRGPRGLHRSSNSLSDGKASAHSTSRPSPQPSPSVRKNNGPATGV